MIARFDDRAEEKKQKEFELERRRAVEFFILYDAQLPMKSFIRKYKIQVSDNPIKATADIMRLALIIDCTEKTKAIARNWLKDHGFLEESEPND